MRYRPMLNQKKQKRVQLLLTGLLMSAMLCWTPPVRAMSAESVVFLHYWTDAMKGGINEMVTAYNKSQPKPHIQATDFEHENFKTVIKALLKSETPPDLFSYWAGERTQTLVTAGYLAPLDDLWKTARLDQHFSPLINQAATYNGKKYLLPVTQHWVGFFYNKALFKRHGLSPPETWTQFETLCQMIQSYGIRPLALGTRAKWPAQFWLDYLLLRTAGAPYRQRLMNGQASYSDPSVKRAMQYWADLIKKGYFNPHANQYDWSEAAMMVHNGEAAMTLMGTWIIGLYEGQLGWRQGGDYDAFPFPVIDKKVPLVSLGPIDGIAMAKRSRHPQEVRKALAFFSGTTAQTQMSRGSGSLAPNQTIPVTFYSDLQQRIQGFIGRSTGWAFALDLATPHPVAVAGLDSLARFMDQPDQVDELLAALQEVARTYFEALPPRP